MKRPRQAQTAESNMNETVIAKIVPAPVVGEGPHRTQGTKVMVGDQQLGGVTRIELVAGINDVWRATIHCMVHPTDLLAEAVVVEPSAWQRFKRLLSGA